MDTNHLSEIKDAEKKLSAFRSQLDSLVRGIWESKNVNPSEVLAAVTELQSLVEWAAQQPDLGTEGVVLLVQLQELNKIRQNLEKTPVDSTKLDGLDFKDELEKGLLQEAENYSNELLDFSEIESPNLSDGRVESNQEEIIPSTCMPFFNAPSSSTEDTNVAFVPNSDTSNEAAETNGKDSLILKDVIETDQNSDDHYDESAKSDIEVQDLLSNTIQDFMKSDKEMKDEFYKDFVVSIEPEIQDILLSDPEAILKHDGESKGMSSKDSKVSEEPSIEILEFLKSDTAVGLKSAEEFRDIGLSGTEVLTESCTESKEQFCCTEAIAKPDYGIQDLLSSESKILPKNNIEIENLLSMETVSNNQKSLRNEVIILETNEDEKTTEWINDPKCSKDPLDVCMFAIRNLYESLRAKENELLKLSVMQNDQKHIEALQGVIIDFHKDITNLNCELDKTKKENALLKEQVLELEEAENDARSEAQKLEQKLVFLQEKDSHSQAEICQLKQNLKKSIDKVAEKESSDKELRSQIKYMETLVQKYEDQVKVMEAKEVAASKKYAEKIENSHKLGDIMKFDKPASCERGTQTYPFQTKLNPQILQNNSNSESQDFDLTISQSTNVPKEIQVVPSEKEATKSLSQNSSISVSEATNIEEEISMGNIDSITQNELMKRLLKLVDEDESLQQQIHHVDQINLTLWQKLQNLENNIGECKRKDINETDISISDNKPGEHNGVSDTKNETPSDIKVKNSIPVENLMSLDQSEDYIKERLTKLEKINVTFEKELKTSQNLRKEKEKKYDEWVQTERRLTSVLKSLSEERNSLVDQVTNLKKEKEELKQRVLQQQTELSSLKEKNQKEIVKIRTEQEVMTLQLHHKVNELITKEKELLKMITSLKLERNKNQDKSELERLKCNYIELQLELSNSREDIRKLEEEFKRRLDECISKHLQEESRRTAELERLSNEKSRCDKMISELQLKQQHLLNALERQEKELKWARECYKKSLEDTEEVHRSVETELKNQLQQMEEGTVIATTALMEERKRVEKELQENIKDLRAKEELYKSRITQLERDVIHLHGELSKVSEDSGLRIDAVMVQENSTSKLNGKSDEPITIRSITYDSHNGPHPVNKSCTSDTDKRPLSRDTLTSPSLPAVNKHQRSSDREATNPVEDTENVEDLRAQVRDLQTQLEKISVEPVEMPLIHPPHPGPAITAPSMGLQKEDIDYAEVDECVADWRKATQNLPAAKGFPLPFQTVYGDKYNTGYKNNVQNEVTSAEKSDEENDYDEVLPRPTNFHVVQQVGSDTLLVGWNYVNPSVLDGYEVYLNNEVHERIYIPDRTKALISGLNLKRPLRLSICALSRYGQMSEPAFLEISCSDMNERCFEDDGEDEYKDFEDSMNRKQRPYSMEW